jgi:hypothetical protein
MRAYRVVWLAVCGVLALVGIAVAFILSPALLLLMVATFAVVAAIVTFAVAGKHSKRPRGETSRTVVTSAAVGGAAAGGIVGLAVMLGAGVLLLLLLLLVGSPYAVRTYGRWLATVPTPSTGQLDALARALAYASPEYVPIQPPEEPPLPSDEQLCRAWRASYRSLQERPSGTDMMRAVEERQSILDELERRNPRALAAWLASGARAAGNPLPYLVTSRDHRPAINWDELTRGQDR